jgi:hypothetical protein
MQVRPCCFSASSSLINVCCSTQRHVVGQQQGCGTPSCQRRLPPPTPASPLPPAACLLTPHPAAEDNLQQQADELQALQAIYGDDFITALDASSFSFALPEPQAQPHLVLRVHLPASYPAQHPPICELSCDFLSGDVLSGLAAQLEGMFAPGGFARGGRGLPAPAPFMSACATTLPALRCCRGGCVYNWIEHLREQWSSLAPPPAPFREPRGTSAAGAAADADAALAAELQAAELLEGGSQEGQVQQRQQRGAANQADEALQEVMSEVARSVVHGEPFTEKRSTFQVCVAATSSLPAAAFAALLLGCTDCCRRC